MLFGRRNCIILRIANPGVFANSRSPSKPSPESVALRFLHETRTYIAKHGNKPTISYSVLNADHPSGNVKNQSPLIDSRRRLSFANPPQKSFQIRALKCSNRVVKGERSIMNI
jgi:hypothetical protein